MLSFMPRGLRRAEAAAYLGISLSHFDKQRALGTVPAPREMLGVLLWDRHDLDALFDGRLPASANDNEWDSALHHEQEETRKHVHAYTDRLGKERIYLRRPGEKRTALPGPLFSHEFWAAYHAAKAAKTVEKLERNPAAASRLPSWVTMAPPSTTPRRQHAR